jgi:D-amino-acid oxidase
MQRDSFAFYSSLAETTPLSGVKLYPMTEYFEGSDGLKAWYQDLMPNYREASPAELPDRCTRGVKYDTVVINPVFFLPLLKAHLEGKGVKFVRAEVKNINEAREMSKAGIVVNASGVGARELAGDAGVRPVRGQTMFVKTDFSEIFMKDSGEYTYVIPRPGSGGVILGGYKTDRLDAEVDVELKSEILKRVNRLTDGAFNGLDLGAVTDIVGFRPGRKGGMRVEREGSVIHAYGAEGAGYIYSFGVAERVKVLIEEGL